MKKGIIFLAVLMLAVVGALAEASDFIGTWVNVEQETDGSLHLLCFTLCEDGRSYWLSYGFDPDGNGASIRLSWAGTWEILEDGSVFVPMNENGGWSYHLGSDGKLYDDITGRIIWERAGGAFVPKRSSVSDWITLSQGVYQIGRDVEPGRYEISSDGFSALTIRPAAGRSDIAFIGDGYALTYTTDLVDGSISISGDTITLKLQFPE